MSDAVSDIISAARKRLKARSLDEAWTLGQQARELDPNRSETLKLLASIAFLKKDYPSAVDLFEQVTRLEPRDGAAYINLGAVHNRMGMFKEAINVLQKGVTKSHGDGNGYYNLAVAYRGLGQSNMAISAYRESLRIDPSNADAHLNLANILIEMSNFPQAVLHYRKALEVKPGFERAQQGLNHALSLGTDAKRSESPFGRLVDTSKRQQSSDVVQRELTEEERLNDRHTIKLLTKVIRETTQTFASHLKSELLPSLLMLNRSVSQQNSDPYAVEKRFREFQNVMQENQNLRRLMKRRMLELRAHEELLNTPSPQGSSL